MVVAYRVQFSSQPRADLTGQDDLSNRVTLQHAERTLNRSSISCFDSALYGRYMISDRIHQALEAERINRVAQGRLADADLARQVSADQSGCPGTKLAVDDGIAQNALMTRSRRSDLDCIGSMLVSFIFPPEPATVSIGVIGTSMNVYNHDTISRKEPAHDYARFPPRRCTSRPEPVCRARPIIGIGAKPVKQTAEPR